MQVEALEQAALAVKAVWEKVASAVKEVQAALALGALAQAWQDSLNWNCKFSMDLCCNVLLDPHSSHKSSRHPTCSNNKSALPWLHKEYL